ncbi:Uncharacterized protein PCOAH_00017950 [Plasmodium coatneyi]|uniref:Uncharacterized protein n=1 Tax=Plasmodium coatneyi TaxID=208452 RepID=A0A1B1DXM3_9APIC|nr:Uncharacterized protein PCOAH_00017950 [Plasmodium coatneyi]ANQ07546.1 Uncharacterized protein PCOAH_00017950 [Plasmodium coatneyi]
MSTIRWVHRKGQNCEKRVISLNEIKERYLNDAANQRKDKRNGKYCPDGTNTETEKKKGKKKLITFYEKRAEKTLNQQKGLTEKNVSNYFWKKKATDGNNLEKKKYCCSGEKGETKNGCSECGGEVDPLGDQHRMFGYHSDMKKGGIDRHVREKSNLCPPPHEQQHVNINLDVNIQWNKQNGKFEKDNCNVGDIRTFYGDKQTWNPIQVSINDKCPEENGYWSESPIGYEQGRSRKEEIPHAREGEKYEKYFRYGNPRDGHYNQHSAREYLQRSHSGGNPLHKNRHMNRFAEECTTYDGMGPSSYVPPEKSYGGHAWENLHYETEKEQNQFRYDSRGKLHPVGKAERHEAETYERGAEEKVHLYVKKAQPCFQHLQKHTENPLPDPLKMQPPKDRQKYSHPVDPKRIYTDAEEKSKNFFQKRTRFFQQVGKRADSNSGESSHFSERGRIGQGKPKGEGSKVTPPECLPPTHDHHKTAYLLSSEEILIREAKQQNKYEQDEKKKKIIFSINKISNIFKKRLFYYLTRLRKYSSVRAHRPVYKKYAKIVSSGEHHHGNRNRGSHSPMSGRTVQYAFPRKVDMPLWSFQKVPNGANCSERGIPTSMGGETPQDGNKKETPLGQKNRKKVSMEETIQKGEVVHHNESLIPRLAKKNSRENFKMYRQLSQRKVLTNTLIDSFIDVDINDQRKKKKYLKFFSILLCLFLRRHMHRQLSSFFSVIGSCHRRQEEKRSIRKFINSRLYAVSILEGALKRMKKKNALRQLALLKKDKQTHNHYSDKPIESTIVKSAPHHVGPSHQDNTTHDKLAGECTEENNRPKLTSSKSHEKPCFGKPKIFRTDDFAIFFKKKILKEKDEILQKCLLRSKSDALLDFLKMSRMENFSKKATCSSAVLNFPDGAYYNDNMRSSTLLDRFFTATYSPDVRTLQRSTYGDKIHLSFYEHMTDNSTLIRSSVNYQKCHNKRETYMHFKRECFETGELNSAGSTSQSDNRGKERLTTNIADAVDEKMGSISEVMNKLGCLIGDSNFLNGVTPAGGDHMDDSSEEDVNDKRCRMFFKQFKKQLTMKCKGATSGEEQYTDDRHTGAEHLSEADGTQNGLSMSDLNSTVGVSK